MIYGKNESSIHEILRKEKEICASFAVTLQTAEVIATVHDKCSVKMEKALNLYNILRETDHIYITFLKECCCNCSVLLVIVGNLLLCLAYKLNFTIGMHV